MFDLGSAEGKFKSRYNPENRKMEYSNETSIKPKRIDYFMKFQCCLTAAAIYNGTCSVITAPAGPITLQVLSPGAGGGIIFCRGGCTTSPP